MQVSLEVRSGLQVGYSINFDSVAIIGRDRKCDLAITDDPRISRQHARVIVQGATVYLEDLGSTNGTRIQKRHITRPVALKNGSFFTVGRTNILVTWM